MQNHPEGSRPYPDSLYRLCARVATGKQNLRLALRVEAGVVRTARFRTFGCPAAIGCAEAACGWSEGRPLAALAAVTPA